MSRVLVVEDDRALASTLAEILEMEGHEVEYRTSGKEAAGLLKKTPWDVVVTDLVLKDGDGFEILQAARKQRPPSQVIMVTGHGSRSLAVRALREGAAYFLEKPIDMEELQAKVHRAARERAREVENRELRRQVDKAYGMEGLVGRSPGMVRLFDILWQIAPTEATVLIRGESGTGKELVARAIHNLSPRREGPFVALNCGGMNEGIIESELFGHVKGAFTGAYADRKGKFEYADGGTLFLDEVGEMPLGTQVKFLRVLEERKVTRLGSNQAREVDVRVVAATNAALEEKVEKGEFRRDLYYRIKVVEVVLPPLREKPEDIPLLVDHFIRHFAQVHDRNVQGIEKEALHALMAHSWPGNVRELKNTLETMVVTSKGPLLGLDDLPPGIRKEDSPSRNPLQDLAGMTLYEVEREMIRAALARHGGNRAKAAASLGIGERTLYRKIKEYGL